MYENNQLRDEDTMSDPLDILIALEELDEQVEDFI